MTAGHLQEKKGYYYIVINYKDAEGNRKTKWEATGLPVKGNKRKAEAMLQEARQNFKEPKSLQEKEHLFSDFLTTWVETTRSSLEETTYTAYCCMINTRIAPYFAKRKLLLAELRPRDIQDYYTERLKQVKAITVVHEHALIHKSLKYAVKMEMISANPATNVERPKAEKYIGEYYNAEEINGLFEVAKGTRIEIAVRFGAFYGLRRSEIVGLKWDAFDFNNNTFTIRHTVTATRVDGKMTQVAKDRAKTKSSLRTLPLVPEFRDFLLKLKTQQEENQKLCGNCYSKMYLDYLYVDEMGERILADTVSSQFSQLLKKHGLKKIRFHDLRHSCASLLLANRGPMKQIQEWLGHSTFATTADTYSHLDFNSKVSAANAIVQGLNL